MAEKPAGERSVAAQIESLQKTVDQLLDVQKAQLIEMRRFVDLLEEVTYVDSNKRKRLGVADIK